MSGLAAGLFFPTANCNVDIKGIDFHGACTTLGFLRSHDGRARTAEGIQYDFTAPRAVLDGIDDKRHRLDGGVHCKVVKPARTKRVDATIIPNVGPVSAATTELDGVEMRRRPHLEDEDKLV